MSRAFIILIVSLVMTGCSVKQHHALVVADVTLSQAIFALQDAEIVAHTAGEISDVAHVRYTKQILVLLLAGDDLTLALRDWKPDQPLPANVGQAITSVAALLTDLQIISPRAGALISKAQTVLVLLQRLGVVPK
jgi:hypothetical protein